MMEPFSPDKDTDSSAVGEEPFSPDKDTDSSAVGEGSDFLTAGATKRLEFQNSGAWGISLGLAFLQPRPTLAVFSRGPWPCDEEECLR